MVNPLSMPFDRKKPARPHGPAEANESDNVWAQMQRALDDLAQAGLAREEKVVESLDGVHAVIAGQKVLCFCSNDYLGLSGERAVRDAAIAAIEKWGVGAGSSRLVGGTSLLHAQLERRLAEFKRTPSAIVAVTGWMANQMAIHALAGAGDLILCDKLNHASIIDACLSSGARLRTYRHGDAGHLESLLVRHRAQHRRCLIVTDSLFSMDGDLAPLAAIAQLKARHAAQLLIDEAHATGVLGAAGRGAAELLGVEEHVDATVGTLSKAIGGLGGFVAGPAVLIETIRNTARPYIFTTALPPALCAAAMASLDIIEAQPQRREHLLAMAQHLRLRLAKMGLATSASAVPSASPSVSQIVPVMLGDSHRALEVNRRLLDRGFLVPAIRPPTVPKGASRLRISLSSLHQTADVDALADALAAER